MIRVPYGPLKRIGNGARASLVAAVTFACSSTATHVDDKKAEGSAVSTSGPAATQMDTDTGSGTGGSAAQTSEGEASVGGSAVSTGGNPGSGGTDSSEPALTSGAITTAASNATATASSGASTTGTSSATATASATATSNANTDTVTSTSGGSDSICLFGECSFDEGLVFE